MFLTVNWIVLSEAYHNETWLDDIRNGGGLSSHGIREFLRLWDCTMDIILSNQEDHPMEV